MIDSPVSHSGHNVRLREATLEDASFVDERAGRPGSMGEFNDFGLTPMPFAETVAGRGRLITFDKGLLLIERIGDGQPIGDISWHAVSYGPGDRSKALNIGLSLIPEARGHGYGTEAQRLVAELLFRLFDIERIEASTDVENIAEQRSLEKAGFTREGTLRGAQWRAGAHHDLVSYSILREDL